MALFERGKVVLIDFEPPVLQQRWWLVGGNAIGRRVLKLGK
jgi:hypothetical protein